MIDNYYMKTQITIWILVLSLSITFTGISYLQVASAVENNDPAVTGAVSNDPSISGAVASVNPNEIKQNPFNIPEVLLQLILRNSEGELLAYIETDDKLGMRPLYLIDYLDGKPNKKIITREGKEYLLIQFETFEPKVTKYHSMAMFSLMTRIDGAPLPILTMNHDAYQVSPGDELTVYWTFLREI